MSFLPQRENLHVEEKKVVKYLLNLDHKDGGSKAKFFLKRGFSPDDWQVFASALAKHGETQKITDDEETRHGRKYEVQCTIETPDGKNPCILSAWIKAGDRPPKLITAHPNT